MPPRPRSRNLRASLLGLHRTLFRVEEASWNCTIDPPLSHLEKMVIALEDRRFFYHSGVDWRSIAREVFKILQFRRCGGFSTIDMQLFRTASNRYERTLRRKVREMVGTWALQRKFSKIEILRSYLTIAYFGTGINGADAAANHLYGVNQDGLSEEESAFIASMLVYPKPRLPSADWTAKVSRRANYGRIIARSSEEAFNQAWR